VQGWRFILGAVLFVSVCLCAPECQAQRAYISGRVVDPHGDAIPEVKLNLLNLTLGLTRNSSSDVHGNFRFPVLLPGQYVLTAQHEGFGPLEIQDLQVGANDHQQVRLTLRVGLASTWVKVNSPAETQESNSASLGGTISAEVIEKMPLPTRDVTALPLLLPGVLPLPEDIYGKGRYRIAGSRVDAVTFLLNGGLDNDLLYNRLSFLPVLDSVAEFHVQTGGYPAEFGRNSGGIITMTTKSGGSQTHGNAFAYLQNHALNANSFFNNLNGLPRDSLHKYEFGLAFGGPEPLSARLLGKDHLFYYVSYQALRKTAGKTLHNVFTYTPAARNGDFSQAGPPDPITGMPTPDPGVARFLLAYPYYQPDPVKAAQAIIDPTKIDPVAANYISAGLIPAAPSGYLTSQGKSAKDDDAVLAKLDFLPEARDHSYLTFGFSRSDAQVPFVSANVAGFATNDYLNAGFLGLSHEHVFSSRLSNTFRTSVNRSNRDYGEPASEHPDPSELGVQIHPDLATGPTSLAFSSGMSLGLSDKGPSHYVSNTYTVTDQFNWEHDRHHVTSGGGISVFQNNTKTSYLVNGQFIFYGTATTNDLADFLLGLPSAYAQAPYAASNIRSKFFFGFAQDDWKISPRLTVNAGLRYEYSTPKTDTQNRLFSIIPGARSRRFPNAPTGMVFPGDPGAPRGTSFPDRNNWAPRISFAWSPFRDGKLRIRWGLGVFYDVLNAEDNLQFNGQEPFASSANVYFSAPPAITSAQTFLSHPFDAAGMVDPFPSKPPPSNLDFAGAGLLPIGGLLRDVYVVDPHLRTPYTFQYTVNLEREISPSLFLQTAYVGSSSHGLTSLVDVNPVVPGSGDRNLNLAPGNSTCNTASGTCSFAAIREFKNISKANYNSLELLVRKAFSPSERFGATLFTFGYTFSHSLDNASGFGSRNQVVPAYSPYYFYASSDADLRHRLVFSGSWTLPFRHYWQSAPARATDGWTLSGIVSWRTGFPLDVFANLPSIYDYTNVGPSGAGDPALVRANLVGPYRPINPENTRALNGILGNYWFDPTAFSNAQCSSNTFLPSAQGCTPGPFMFPSDQQAITNPSVRTYGTVPRNYLRGPGAANVDLAVVKSVPLKRESIALEFRIELHNALNHTQFANPSTDITDYFFGQITDTAPPRTAEIGLRLVF
jgi:hypothetical protein